MRNKTCSECKEIRVIYKHGMCKGCCDKQREKDREFYLTIWEERQHVCEGCACCIGEARSYTFHHLLEKAKFPQFRYYSENICLLCWTCHSQIHTFADKLPVIRDKARKLHDILFN